MVLYVNVHLNQRVEVKLNGRILTATVCFKGCLNGIQGDWVGLCMDTRVGRHNGLLNGRRYFQCPPGHGIFIKASHLRFIPTIRQLYHSYRTVEPTDDENEEDLFYHNERDVNGNIYETMRLDNPYSKWTQSDNFPDEPFAPFSCRPLSYHRRHAVGRRLPSVAATRPRTAYGRHPTPTHVEYGPEDDFISSPSIPCTHMPHSALREQARRGWHNDHYTRYMSLNTGRDAIKYAQWNDISA